MAGITPFTITLTVGVTPSVGVQCTANTGILPSTVYWEADAANAGVCYVGISGMSPSSYIARINPGQGFSLSSDAKGNVRPGSPANIQLSALYICGANAGDIVHLTYLFRYGG